MTPTRPGSRRLSSLSPVLVTCIDARKKYLKGCGDTSTFDAIIDITELVRYRPEYEHRPEFPDRLPETIYADTDQQIVSVLEKLRASWVVFFAPQESYSALWSLVPALRSRGITCDFSLNRHTICNAFRTPQTFLRQSITKALSRGALLGKQVLPVDKVYLPHKNALAGWQRLLRPKQFIKVKHMDAPRHASWNGDYGVFIDSYFPFHNEFRKYGQRLDPVHFYARVRQTITQLKRRHNLSHVYISRHPNSNGEEIPYIAEFAHPCEDTNQLLAGASIAWSFASDAAGIANAYRLRTYNVTFPDMFPPKLQEYITRKSHGLGIPLISACGNSITPAFCRGPLSYIKRHVYRQYYAANSPTLAEAIANIQKYGSTH